jgi:membrane protease YdiL (CAAX protease family)
LERGFPKVSESKDDYLDRIKWKFSDSLISLLVFVPLLLALLVPLTLLLGIFSVHISTTLENINTWSFLVLYLLQVGVMFGLVWFFAIKLGQAHWSELGLRSYGIFRSLVLALTAFILIFASNTTYGLIASRFVPMEDLQGRVSKIILSGRVSLALLIPIVIFIAPIVEEIFFRGFVYPAFRKKMGVVWGILLSALVFTLFHLEPYQIPPLLVIGAILAFIYERTRSLVPVIILHGLNNAFYMLVLMVFMNISRT